jgi:hypothetical protein
LILGLQVKTVMTTTKSLIIVVHVLLSLNVVQQVVALLVHLRVFAATVRRRTVIVVHLVVVDAVVEGGWIGVSKIRFEH